MTNKDNGGPAFPLAFEDDIQTKETFVQYGMTLRDYFAAKAMQGYCSREDSIECEFSSIASDSYAMADAMLEARNK